MSLKAFHILFIVLSVGLTLVVGAWGVQQYVREGSNGGLILAGIFFASGFLLVVYGVRFFKKLVALR